MVEKVTFGTASGKRVDFQRRPSADGNSGVAGGDDAADSSIVAGIETVSPGDIAGSDGTGNDSIALNADGTPRKRRGRKPGAGTGSRSGSTATSKKANLAGIESILFSAHLMAAAAFKMPELALTQDDNAKLAAAFADVAQHYPIGVDPKTAAWVNFGIVAAGLYVPRVIAARKRKTGKVVHQSEAVAEVAQPGDSIMPTVTPGTLFPDAPKATVGSATSFKPFVNGAAFPEPASVIEH